MDGDAKLITWRDWTVVGLRFLLILFVCGIAALPRIQDGSLSYTYSDILVMFVVGALANVVLIGVLLVPSAHPAIQLVITVGDWALAAASVSLNQSNLLLLILVGGLVIVTSALRIGYLWSIADTLGVIVATVIPLALAAGANQLSAVLAKYDYVLLALGMFGIFSMIWSYIIQHENRSEQRQLREKHETKSLQLSDLKERTRAIYEMAEALSGNLSTEKILTAAMNAGWLGLRENERRNRERLVSAVMLFRTTDNELEIITGRGLSRTDEGRTTAGKNGIIAQSIKEAVPILSNNVRKDPELSMFIAFQGLRSVLCLPLRAGFDTYGVLLYGSDKPDAFTDEHLELLTAISMQATVALQNAVLYQNLLKERDKIVQVDEEARKKLARDLHDGPTQNVAAIAMRMNIIQRMLERTPDDVPEELRKVEELARKTTKEIRHMLFTLRPLVLENKGLTAALEELATKMRETHNQGVAVRVSPDAERVLNTQQQGTIFYIIEEAVGNARKHAAAELISIGITKTDDVVVVKIVDNGVGFNVSAVEANYDQRGSLGMVNLRERTELLGGTLRIDSAEGKGTSITVLVPLRDSASSQSRPARAVANPNTKLAAAAMERIRSAHDG